MDEWIKTVISGAAGGLTSGVLLLIGAGLQHWLRKTEKLHELLTDRTVVAWSQLWEKLVEFSNAVSLVREHGPNALLWFSGDSYPSHVTEDQKSHGKKFRAIYEDLKRFVYVNEIFLGGKAVAALEEYLTAFDMLRFRAHDNRSNRAPGLAHYAILDLGLMGKFEGKILEAVRERFQGCKIDVLCATERSSARERGRRLADKLIKEADDALNSNNTRRSQE